MSIQILPNYIGKQWVHPTAVDQVDVINPATTEVINRIPLSSESDVDRAVQSAAQAFQSWRETPATDRIQYLFALKQLLEEHLDQIAQTITIECGKTLTESKGELRRAIENVEVACGIPILMQGYNSEDIASGIDETMIRQPVGVCAAITPFNFPAMIAFWFMPYAIACGNTFVIKPSEKVPQTTQQIIQLLDQTELPEGVVNLVHGGQKAAEALIDHPQIKAISFVGSTEVARQVYARSTANGKRAQCQGGAKNPIIVLPDADLEMTSQITADSAFGCAGQRCLAASIVVTVADAKRPFTEAIAEQAVSRVVGSGLNESVQMGPVITAESKMRIENLVQSGVSAGADLLVDGRQAQIDGFEDGYFIRPTILENVDPGDEIVGTEIFGPVLSLIHVETVDDAIQLVNSGRYGNMACLFTSNGAAARQFRYQAQVGNIGINLGVAAPMAFFPFSGWRDSFFGDMHGQGRDAVEFFTQKKVVVERWFSGWSRKF
ncbi:methylmalonate-semialdehyde dehydrogenase (CoA acylating) [Candidatus Poribacteria bacterium]|nr:methylmalonate-semialdehyde dehydrogenase (CoA acylating) [Candidatus Poribacteria bacterium]